MGCHVGGGGAIRVEQSMRMGGGGGGVRVCVEGGVFYVRGRDANQ